MKRLFLFLTIALGFVAQARAGGIDTLWTKPYDYMVGGFVTMAINHDSTIVAVGSENGYVKLYEINTGDSLACFQKQNSVAYTLSFSPDGEHFAYGFSYSGVSMINLNTMKIDTTFSDMIKLIYSSKDSNIIYINEHNLKLLNKDDFTVLKTLELTDTISNMFISQDYSKAVIVETHETKPLNFYYIAYIVSLDSFKILKSFTINSYYDLQFSPDGKEIAIAGDDGIDFYNIDSGKVTRRLITGDRFFWSIAYPSFEGYFVTGVVTNNRIMFVNGSTLKVIESTKIPIVKEENIYDTPKTMSFSNCNKKLLSAGAMLVCFNIENFTHIEVDSANQFFIFPSPSNGNVSIIIPNSQQISSIQITNSNGVEENCEYIISSDRVTIFTDRLSAGLYFVRLAIVDSSPITYKFVKE